MTVGVYTTLARDLPISLRELVKNVDTTNFEASYLEKYPESDGLITVVTQTAKSRSLGNLQNPIVLIPKQNETLDKDTFIFIIDRDWMPDEDQKHILEQENISRITLGIDSSKNITSINEQPILIQSSSQPMEPSEQLEEEQDELETNLNTTFIDPGKIVRESNPIQMKREDWQPSRPISRNSRSADRTGREELLQTNKEQRWRIRNLSNQLEQQQQNHRRTTEQSERLEQELREQQEKTQSIIQDRVREEINRRIPNRTIHTHDSQNNNVNSVQRSTARNDHTNRIHLNTGKIQVPIFDSNTSDINEIMSRMETIIKFLAQGDNNMKKALIFQFIQKNSWEHLAIANPNILEDFDELRKELQERYQPTGDSTELYLSTVQKQNEDEKDYLQRLTRTYRQFMKIDQSIPLNEKDKDALKRRFVSTLYDKEVRIKMRSEIEGIEFNEVAEKSRQFRRVLEMENGNHTLMSTVSFLQSKIKDIDLKISSKEHKEKANETPPQNCNQCGLAHPPEECEASAKFKRKNNKKRYNRYNQAYSIPQRKLDNNLKENPNFPTAEPTQPRFENRGRQRYGDFRNEERNKMGYNRYNENYNRNQNRRRYQNSNRVRFNLDNDFERPSNQRWKPHWNRNKPNVWINQEEEAPIHQQAAQVETKGNDFVF